MLNRDSHHSGFLIVSLCASVFDLFVKGNTKFEIIQTLQLF